MDDRAVDQDAVGYLEKVLYELLRMFFVVKITGREAAWEETHQMQCRGGGLWAATWL